MNTQSLYLNNEMMFPTASAATEVGGSFCLGVAIGTFVGVIIH